MSGWKVRVLGFKMNFGIPGTLRGRLLNRRVALVVCGEAAGPSAQDTQWWKLKRVPIQRGLDSGFRLRSR